MNKLQALNALNVQKIERISSSLSDLHVEETENGPRQWRIESERQLFHGTRGENIIRINAQRGSTGALVDSLVSCGEYSIQPDKGRVNI